jgi:hypothetical protein
VRKIFKHWRKLDNVLLVLAIITAIWWGFFRPVSTAASGNITITAISTSDGVITDGHWLPIYTVGESSEAIFEVTSTFEPSYNAIPLASLNGDCGDYATIYWSYMADDNWIKVDSNVVLLSDVIYQFKLTITIAEDCPICSMSYRIGCE